MSDVCKDCNGDGGYLVNPDWPMGDCGDRKWVPCDCGAPSRMAEVFDDHRLQYGHDRFGTPYTRCTRKNCQGRH